MPRGDRIPPKIKEAYYVLRDVNSRAAAAKGAHISVNSAEALDRMRNEGMSKTGPEIRAERFQAEKGEPHTYEEICQWADDETHPEQSRYIRAKRGWENFAFFQRTYLGRIAIPWQVEAAQRIVQMIESEEEEWAVINCPPGSGKATSLDTPILTTSGWSTMGDLKVGDLVYDESGQPTPVIAKSPVWYGHRCFRVTTDDGAEMVVNAAHEWEAIVRRDMGRSQGRPPGPGRQEKYTTLELATIPQRFAPSIPVCGALDGPDRELTVDPYTLGIWLGDGTSVQANVSCPPEDAKWIRGYIEDAGYLTSDYSNPLKFGIRGGFQTALRGLGLLGNKHIPIDYLLGSKAQRLALLRGLIDSDGSVRSDGLTVFVNTNRDLADGVLFLARSMGVKATIRTCGYADDPTRQVSYSVFFHLEGSARLPRKAMLTRNALNRTRRFLKIEEVPSVPTQCMTVEADSHLFLGGHGLIVSHQSTTFTHDIPCWLTVRDRAITGLIGTAVQTNGKLYIQNLKETFERTLPMKAHTTKAKLGLEVDAEATLAEDYGRFKPETGGIWAADRFVVSQMDGQATNQKEPTWSCYGRQGGVLGMRYQFVIWDDLVDPARLGNQQLIDEDQEWYSDIAESRLEPGGTFILQGQRLGPNDLYGYALAMKGLPEEIDAEAEYDEDFGTVPKYHHLVYKAHYEELCENNHKVSSPAYGELGGCLLFPRRLSWKRLSPIMVERQNRFRVVYQQEEVDPETVLVQKDWVSGAGGNVGCWDKDRDHLQVPAGVDLKRCISVVAVDPSPTQYWGIGWWLIDPLGLAGPTRFLIDLERRGMGANKFLDYIVATQEYTGLAELWQQRSYELGIPITHWIVEKNGAQQFMLQTDMINNWQRQHGVKIIPHTTTAINKNSEELGIQALIPGIYERGLVRLPGKGSSVGRAVSLKLVEEVTQHPHSRTTDCLMEQWFLEIHLPELLKFEKRHSEDRIPARRPSWFGEEQAHLKRVVGLRDRPTRVSAKDRMLTLTEQRLERQEASA